MGEKNQGKEEREGRKNYFLETRNNPAMTRTTVQEPSHKIHLKLPISTVSTLERNYFHKNFSIEFCPSSFMILRLSCPHWSQEKRMISIDQTKHSNPGAGSKLERQPRVQDKPSLLSQSQHVCWLRKKKITKYKTHFSF